MATIITKETGATAVNRPLTTAELDNNFINLNADVATRILSSEKAAVNGVATLDAAGKLLTAQLPATGVTQGSYGSATAIPVITVDATGRLTLVSTVAVSIPSGSISVTGGDFTLSGNTGTAITNATLATVNSNTGTFNTVTVNGKGLVTAASNASYVLSGDITTLRKQEFTATAAQTTFTITDGYSAGTVQVFANGIALAAADFTATNGTTVVLAEARVAGDNIIVTSGGIFQPSGGTTTNALTVGTGLTLNSGTTFNGSVARTISLANTGVSAQTVGGSTSIPVLTVDSTGRITNISTATPSGGGSSNSFSIIYPTAGGTLISPTTGSTSLVASTSDSLYLLAGSGIQITASNSPSKAIMISATGGAAAPSTNLSWTYGGTGVFSMTVPLPSGATTSGNKVWIAIVGRELSLSKMTSVTCDGYSFTYVGGYPVSGNNEAGILFYALNTGSNLIGASTITISFNGYANAAMSTAWVTTTNSMNAVTAAGTTSTASNIFISPNPSYTVGNKLFLASTSFGLSMTTAVITPSGWTSNGTASHPNSTLTVAVLSPPDPFTAGVSVQLLNSNTSIFTYAGAQNS